MNIFLTVLLRVVLPPNGKQKYTHEHLQYIQTPAAKILGQRGLTLTNGMQTAVTVLLWRSAFFSLPVKLTTGRVSLKREKITLKLVSKLLNKRLYLGLKSSKFLSSICSIL